MFVLLFRWIGKYTINEESVGETKIARLSPEDGGTCCFLSWILILRVLNWFITVEIP